MLGVEWSNDPDHSSHAGAGRDRAGRWKERDRLLSPALREKLLEDPFSGCVVIFRSRSGTAIRLLTYDGQGYWLVQKRLSKGCFRWWPEADQPAKKLEAYEAQLLLAAGDVSRVRAAPMWRRVDGPN